MSKIDEILIEINSLFDYGLKLQLTDKKNDLPTLSINYENWYTKSLKVISVIIPERLEDFRSAYKLDKRKDVTYDTYTISDYLIGLVITRGSSPVFNIKNAYGTKLLRQLSILKAALEIAPTKLRDLKTVLQSELFDNDIDSAKELLNKGHLRSSGVICGVVLERHLNTICQNHKITFRKKNLSISDYNDALKESGIYDVPFWRYIQRLSDIRNLCAHSKDREPTKEEVQDLISGTDKVLKEIF